MADIKRIKERLIRLNLASGRIRDRLYGEHNVGRYDGSTAQNVALAAHLRHIKFEADMIAYDLGLEL